MFPFEEEGDWKAHEVNATRAKDGVYDAGCARASRRSLRLKPARYGKTELTHDVVTSPSEDVRARARAARRSAAAGAAASERPAGSAHL